MRMVKFISYFSCPWQDLQKFTEQYYSTLLTYLPLSYCIRVVAVSIAGVDVTVIVAIIVTVIDVVFLVLS